MPPATLTTYTSAQVCDLLNLTYRRLDYLTRTGALVGDTMNRGSGSRRVFTRDQIERLAVAQAITASLPTTRASHSAGSAWPTIAAAVMTGPRPPAKGFAVLDTVGTLRYPTQLTVDDVPNGAIVLHYDASPVWDRLDADA